MRRRARIYLEVVDLFNELVGPIVGLEINPDGTVTDIP